MATRPAVRRPAAIPKRAATAKRVAAPKKAAAKKPARGAKAAAADFYNLTADDTKKAAASGHFLQAGDRRVRVRITGANGKWRGKGGKTPRAADLTFVYLPDNRLAGPRNTIVADGKTIRGVTEHLRDMKYTADQINNFLANAITYDVVQEGLAEEKAAKAENRAPVLSALYQKYLSLVAEAEAAAKKQPRSTVIAADPRDVLRELEEELKAEREAEREERAKGAKSPRSKGKAGAKSPRGGARSPRKPVRVLAKLTQAEKKGAESGEERFVDVSNMDEAGAGIKMIKTPGQNSNKVTTQTSLLTSSNIDGIRLAIAQLKRDDADNSATYDQWLQDFEDAFAQQAPAPAPAAGAAGAAPVRRVVQLARATRPAAAPAPAAAAPAPAAAAPAAGGLSPRAAMAAQAPPAAARARVIMPARTIARRPAA